MPASFASTPSLAADIIVDSGNDNAPTSADCKLRSAVIAANTDAPHGGCTAGVGPDRIVFNGVRSITLQNSSLEVTEDLTIDGQGRPVRIRRAPDDENRFRIIMVSEPSGSAALTLRYIGIETGLTDADSVFGDNGGGIFSSGSVLLEDSLVRGNGTSTTEGAGGGIYADEVTVVRSEISQNQTAFGGGGIYAEEHIMLVDSTVADNIAGSADANGGGLLSRGSLECVRSTLVGNEAGMYGGGAFGITSSFRNCTVSGNAAQFGGGIVAGVTNVQHSTVTDNLASDNASGGIGSVKGGGFPHSLSISNSIVAGNVGDLAALIEPVFLAGVNNIIGPVAGNVDLPDGTLDCDPELAPLADNGGPTQTHAFTAGSCAHDAGSNPFDEVVDQRGLPRTSGATTDIGAYELQAPELFADGFE